METLIRSIDHPASWILLPPGNRALLRYPSPTMPAGSQLATAADLLVANLGRPFPWDALPSSERAGRLWRDQRIGLGGLIHDRWFVTQEGRFGGAPNVPEQLPGSLRCCLYLDGGPCSDQLEDNEGYALVRLVEEANLDLYRRVQLHAAEHVMADGGAIIVTPLSPEGETWVGFVGRCQECPNPELISFRQLQKSVADYRFRLLPEWQGW